jgi:peptidoglycan pentaglycine glycine transferase (the first glycine)
VKGKEALYNKGMQSLLQTKMWAEFKASQGWLIHEIEVAGTPRSVFVLERLLRFGKSLLYAPEVTLPEYSEQALKALALDLRGKATYTPICFRLELLEKLGGTDNSLTAALTNAGYTKAFEETQPEHRQWMDISHDEATILANMKEKGRYNTRLAQKKGVNVRISANTSDVDIFYSMFETTSKRNGFSIRSKQYFIDLCTMLFAHNVGELVIAEYEGQPLSALIITYYDGLASYLYGASSNEQRNVMAPNAAHFAAIQSAKKRECTIYDLLQVAPGDADEKHHYSRLTQFKQQFGGERVDLVGGWDYVYSSPWYQVFKFAEQLRRH